ncbi:MAG TPA: nuclease A inhibitor family protein [Pyrinomonadaceae bacterium]|jgi:hypothetical protein
MKSDQQFLQELKEAASGLWVMSESDYPFEIVQLEGEAEPGQQLLRQVSGSPPDAPVEGRTVDEFFRTKIYYAVEGSRPDENVTQRTQSILKLLRENLTELRVYRVGTINIAVLILGKSREGNWLGLSTRVVET